MKMAGASPATRPQRGSATSITDLDTDALANCAKFLRLQDVLNMAMSCKQLQAAAYSDSIWHPLFRWPSPIPSRFPHQSGAREAYLSRIADLQQFKFRDPLVSDLVTEMTPGISLLMDKNNIILSQVHVANPYFILDNKNKLKRTDARQTNTTLRGHNARVSCMRLIPIDKTPFLRNKCRGNEMLLVTSSLDSIRIWRQGRCLCCLSGHNGPVSTLSDGLVGSFPGKLIASGGQDGTVRLWSVKPGRKCGENALKATLHGHDKPAVLLSVARRNKSLLVSISKNSKVMVWDATTTSSVRHSSLFVGMTTVPGTPVGMKCHESLVYIAAGSSVVGIDLRTMHNVLTLKLEEDVHSFEMLPQKSLICTGLTSKAMLWDVRKSSDLQKRAGQRRAVNVAEMSGHVGKINPFLHVDSYKIVTGGHEERCLNVWGRLERVDKPIP